MEREGEGALRRLALRAGRGYRGLADAKYTTVAGTLVFFLVLSLVPLLFFFTLLFGGRLAAEEVLVPGLFDWARGLVAYLGAHASGATAGAGIFFLATTFWSGTGFFYHLRRGGEIIYGVRSGERGLRLRLSAVFFTVAMLLFLCLAGGTVAGADVMTRSLPRRAAGLVTYTVVTLCGFFAAWLLNGFACPCRGVFSDLAAGSALTAASWLIAAVLFRWYLRFSDPTRLYGALSVIVVFLLFLYWLMICFTAGMTYNFHRVVHRLEARGVRKG